MLGHLLLAVAMNYNDERSWFFFNLKNNFYSAKCIGTQNNGTLSFFTLSVLLHQQIVSAIHV